MTTSTTHPLLRAKRPLILTRPAERFAGAARTSVELGCDAIWVEGKGRVGKTFGCRQLIQSETWRPFPMYIAEFTYGKATKPTESYFMSSLLEQMGQTVPVSASSNMLATRFVRLLHERRNKLAADVIGLVINEANRFTSEDYEHVVTISNEIEKTSRAFFFLINQSDAGRLGTGTADCRPPPHVYGRFFTNSHQYTGLLWDVRGRGAGGRRFWTVALGLLGDRGGFTWREGSGVSCTGNFGPEAWADGWRLGAQIDLIRTVINKMRAEVGLFDVVTWPMQTFERFVYFVLVRIANGDSSFRRLTEEHIREALLRADYFGIEPGYVGGGS